MSNSNPCFAAFFSVCNQLCRDDGSQSMEHRIWDLEVWHERMWVEVQWQNQQQEQPLEYHLLVSNCVEFWAWTCLDQMYLPIFCAHCFKPICMFLRITECGEVPWDQKAIPLWGAMFFTRFDCYLRQARDRERIVKELCYLFLLRYYTLVILHSLTR